MKKYIFVSALLTISSLLLSGCMTTWPIVDDLDHYKKWDTYESRKINNVEWNEIPQSGEELIINNEDIENQIEIDYWTSDIFSNEEIDEVINLVLNTYETWSSHPQVYKMYYNSDEMSLYELNYFEEYLWLKFDKCLVIYSNFYMDLDESENVFETDNITDYSRTACKYTWLNRELVNHWYI